MPKMETTELIRVLREEAEIVEYPEMEQVMREAADRLETLQESVAALSIIKTDCKSIVKQTAGEVTIQLLRNNDTEGTHE
jgi:hypothetical protein